MPFTSDDRAFYSNADASDGAFGFGFQAGMLFQASDQVSIGASYTSPQSFQDFKWQAVYENPFLPTYGMPRDMVFNPLSLARHEAQHGLTIGHRWNRRDRCPTAARSRRTTPPDGRPVGRAPR